MEEREEGDGEGRRTRIGVVGSDAGEEVTCEAVAARCGGGVGAVGCDHVVDGGEVDGVVCDADEGGEEQGGDPGDAAVRAQARPGEAEQADALERGEEQKEPEALFWLQVLGAEFADELALLVEDGQECKPADEVAH